MASIVVRVLGGSSVRFGESDVTSKLSLKSLAMFVYLLIERDKFTSRDFLATMFWPELPNDRARSNLRRVLYLINDLAGAEGFPRLILAKQNILEINPEFEIDFDVSKIFNEINSNRHIGKVERSQLIASVQNLELYKGPLFGGAFPWISEDFEKWSVAQAAQCELIVQSECLNALNGSIMLGDYMLAIRIAECLLMVNPDDERHYQIILNLFKSIGWDKCFSDTARLYASRFGSELKLSGGANSSDYNFTGKNIIEIDKSFFV